MDCYKKSASQNNQYAYYNLGLMYENGRGVTIDKSMARYYYQKAADLGSQSAKDKLNKL